MVCDPIANGTAIDKVLADKEREHQLEMDYAVNLTNDTEASIAKEADEGDQGAARRVLGDNGTDQLFIRTLHPDDRDRVLTAHARPHRTHEPLSHGRRGHQEGAGDVVRLGPPRLLDELQAAGVEPGAADLQFPGRRHGAREVGEHVGAVIDQVVAEGRVQVPLGDSHADGHRRDARGHDPRFDGR